MTNMTEHSYSGDYKSAIARAKRVLLAAGFEWSRTIGRYSAFCNTQTTTHGVKVTRVGCSETIALHVYAGMYAERAVTRAEEKRAIEALRAAGMPFDDRGWLACGRDGRGKIATDPQPPAAPAIENDEIENARAAIMAQVDRQLERLPAALRRAVRESLIATLEAEISE